MLNLNNGKLISVNDKEYLTLGKNCSFLHFLCLFYIFVLCFEKLLCGVKTFRMSANECHW